MPKIKWRAYLKGEYIIDDENLRNKIHHDIRRRARRMMEDLLLIAQNMPKRQRILIFQNIRRGGKFYDTIMRPLVMELINNSCVHSPEEEDFEKIKHLTRGLEIARIKYDLVRLIEDKRYRELKEFQLSS